MHLFQQIAVTFHSFSSCVCACVSSAPCSRFLVFFGFCHGKKMSLQHVLHKLQQTYFFFIANFFLITTIRIRKHKKLYRKNKQRMSYTLEGILFFFLLTKYNQYTSFFKYNVSNCSLLVCLYLWLVQKVTREIINFTFSTLNKHCL